MARKAADEHVMSGWQTLSSEEVYQTPWIRVKRDEVINHAGRQLTYSVVEARHPSVFIVAINSEGKILMQKNYRYTIDKTIWELPAGSTDGEDGITAGRRELFEETGLTSEDWTELGTMYQGVGTSNYPFIACIARNVTPGKGHAPETIEQIEEQRFFSIEEIETMIKDGVLVDGADLGVLYAAKLHGV